MIRLFKKALGGASLVSVVLVAWAAVGLSGCGDRRQTAETAADPLVDASTFEVLATSDLKDAQALEGMAYKATGVKLKFRFGGTMESTEAVLTGQAKSPAAWFANAKYLLSDAQGQSRVKVQEKIMLSPIAVGVSESVAQKLGWDRPEVAAKVTWKTITEAAGRGQLAYALSNPATSNQGFMALMGVVAAASNKAEALTAQDVDRQAIATFLKGYKLAGDNSSYLTEKFIERQGPSLNAFINYESWLLSLNASGKLREKLVLVYPREGVATADYPFMLLDETRRDDYLKLVNWLKGTEAQTWLAKQTLRRPVNAEVAASLKDAPQNTGMLLELPFSPDRRLADGLIAAYLNEFRKPIASTFVLDVSGSMSREGRIGRLIEAIHYMAGDDASLTGRIARLTEREKVWLLPFSSLPNTPVAFEIPASARTQGGVALQADSEPKLQAMADVRAFASQLRTSGGTALYDSILAGLTLMAEQRRLHPDYQYSVIGFTDGENTEGRDLAAFQAAYAAMPEDVRAIPVFMVLFGDAKEQELNALVKVTGGKVFDARKGSLYGVFKEIRAYQ